MTNVRFLLATRESRQTALVIYQVEDKFSVLYCTDGAKQFSFETENNSSSMLVLHPFSSFLSCL